MAKFSSARSVELSYAHQLVHTAKLIHGTEFIEVFTVPSRDRSTEHKVAHIFSTGKILCDCQAGQHGNSCGHAGTVIVYCDQRAACYAATTDHAA